jgi:hypothetical protein
MFSLWTCLSLHDQWEFVVIINTYTNKIKQTIIVTTQTNTHNANKCSQRKQILMQQCKQILTAQKDGKLQWVPPINSYSPLPIALQDGWRWKRDHDTLS